MREQSLLLLLTLAAACGDRTPIPSKNSLRVTAGQEQVELGKAFLLEVARVWSKQQAPAGWSDKALAPLAVRLLGTTRREDDSRVEEVRRYRAYAFSLGDVSVPVPSGEPLELEVKRALDPAAPGPAELPGGPLHEPLAWHWWLLGGVAALASVVVLVRLRRRPEPPLDAAVTLGPPQDPAHLRALQRIGRLRPRHPQGRDEMQSYYVEASGILREYVGERFGVGSAEMTTQELVAAVRAPRLGEVLGHCDLVKFARHLPAAPERERMLAAAETFVRETA